MSKRVKKIAIKDVFKVADALFSAADGDGWVNMLANRNGRTCINALFPRARIAWRDAGEGAPEDWRGFRINVPDVAEATEHKLPLEITGGTDLHDAKPEALAFLLAIGVNQQGGRSGFLDRDGIINICKPRSAIN